VQDRFSPRAHGTRRQLINHTAPGVPTVRGVPSVRRCAIQISCRVENHTGYGNPPICPISKLIKHRFSPRAACARCQLKHHACPRGAKFRRAIEISRRIKNQIRDWPLPVGTSERVQDDLFPAGRGRRELERNSAITGRVSAIGSGAVKVSRKIENQGAEGISIVWPAGENVNRVLRPAAGTRRQLEIAPFPIELTRVSARYADAP
jgi:hypothetical protein